MSNIINIQQIQEQDVTLAEAQSLTIMHDNEIFTYFDEGTSRYVFVNADKTKVIKMHKHRGHGFDFNKEESTIYNEASDLVKSEMAKTKLINGFIEQEFCLPIQFAGKKLTMDQIRFARSCRNEVGWDKDGNLVCFDLDEYKKY